MKTIELTQGQVAKVSDEDYAEQNQYEWCASWNEGTQSYYATRAEGKRPNRKTVYMHREIMATPDGMKCDHIDHDTLFNCRENLRNVTHSQNLMNRKGAQSNNQLGEKGISRNGNGFEVRVSVGGEYIYRKTFRTLDDAVSARDEAVKKYHGEFGNI